MAFSLHLNLKYGNLFRSYSNSRARNPYDVLGLKCTSSPKDVKKAYIKLCKELHPDMKPGDASQHKKFIELNNAYTDLVNSEYKRQNIRKGTSDNQSFSWKSRQSPYSSQNDWQSEKAWYEKEEYQEYFHQRDKKNAMNMNHRKANSWVITGCFILMILGSVLYFSAYSYASRYTLHTVDEKSRRISENYYDVRKNALEKGRAEQLDNLKKKWND